MNDKIGKYYAVVKILFPTFRQCCLLQGDKTISPSVTLKKAALPKRREQYFDYSVVFTYFVIRVFYILNLDKQSLINFTLIRITLNFNCANITFP